MDGGFHFTGAAGSAAASGCEAAATPIRDAPSLGRIPDIHWLRERSGWQEAPSIVVARALVVDRPFPNSAVTGEVIMKSSVIVIGLLLAGSVAISRAAPPDSPDTVYIDGTPCNRLCQSYLAWSRATLSGASAQIPPKVMERRTAATKAGTSAVKPKHVARQATPTASAQRDKIAGSQQPTGTVPTPVTKPAEAAVRKPAEEVAGLQQPAGNAAPSPVSKPADTPDLLAKDSLAKTGSAPGSKDKTIRDQVMAAAAVAEQLTLATTAASELKAMGAERPLDAGAATPASPNQTDGLVALVMSRPEIKSVTDLAGKNVAMDGRSGSANDVRIALVAAGAAEVQLSSGETKAIDRWVSGDVPAVVLALVSPDAAETFPEIAGFKVFRVPLSPGR
jgi:hypothetical protein